MRLFRLSVALLLPVASVAAISPAQPRSFQPPVAVSQERSDAVLQPPDTTAEVLRTKRGGGGKGSTAPQQSTLVTLGYLLAANSGFLNGLALNGLLAGRKQPVSAVTGAWTTSAIGFAYGNGKLFMSQFAIILCYLVGACLNGMLNPHGIDWSCNPVSLLIMAALVLIGNLFHTWTTQFMALLAMVNGMQNSWTSMLLSNNLLRTAHFSGITSDIGTYLGQSMAKNDANKWKLKIFTQLAGSFWMGGVLSVVFAEHFQEMAFLASVAFYIWTYVYLTSPDEEVVVKQE